MALPFPLVPVLVGAAVGAVITYILTARSARNQFTDTLQDLGESIEAGAKKAKTVAADTVEEAAGVVKDAASKVID